MDTYWNSLMRARRPLIVHVNKLYIKRVEQLQNTRPLHLHASVCFEEQGN